MVTYVKDTVVKRSHDISFFLNLSFEKDGKNNLFNEQNAMLLRTENGWSSIQTKGWFGVESNLYGSLGFLKNKLRAATVKNPVSHTP